ncbi:MAG TPA: HAD family acid phosphatase [Candidatus Limnocylindrales bacterium]|jgi:predicted secreted acid phosphatase
MRRLSSLRPARSFAIGLAAGLALATAGIVAAGNLNPPKIKTPKTEDQVTNLDVLRLELKNYYGTSNATTGNPNPPTVAGWTLPLNLDSNYAAEALKVTKDGTNYLNQKANSHKYPMKAIVLDVDDTTLTTWNYELFSNWDYNPTTNAQFVGGSGTTFTGNAFPATPGMLSLVQRAKDLGYAIFFITGRGDSQHQQTIANLVSDTAAGYSDATTVTIGPNSVPDVDAGYPMPTSIDTGHDSGFNGNVNFKDGLFTKPAVGSYPAYLNQAQFCASAITAGTSCATIAYKSGTRAYIESQGYTIVANFGDQLSDLIGGFSAKTFKMPNPNYYLP